MIAIEKHLSHSPPSILMLMMFTVAGGCDPYCTVSVDDPPQQQSTSIVKNTVNPFFDEHFLL